MTKHLRRFAALAAALAVAASAPVPRAQAREAHVLRYADELDVTTLNPVLATSANITWLSEMTLAYLTRIDDHANPTPELATVVPSQSNGGISRDGKTITWHLRRGVKWSDGQPFDADDVVFSVGVIQNPANNITTRDGWDNILRVDEPDKYTVVFHLRAPYASFFERYFGSDGGFIVMPKHILGGAKTINDAPYNALPVGIGPFRYSAFKRGDSVEMEANPYYFRGRPKLNKVIYKIITDDNTLFTQLQTGEVDLWSGVNGAFYDRVKALPGKTVVTVPSPFTSSILFNVARPLLRERAVRQALRAATNRPQLFDKVYHHAGTLVESVVPTVTKDYDPSIRPEPFDLARARSILDRAGWKLGPGGVRVKNGATLSLDIAIPSTYRPSSTTAEILRDTWAQIGVKVNTKAYATSQYFAPYSAGGILQNGNWDISLLSESTDPLATILPNFGCKSFPPNGLNIKHYCNPAVDQLVTTYGTIYDDRARKPLAARFQRMIDDDAPEIVTYQRALIYAYDPALKNFHPKAFGVYDDMMNVDI